MTLPRASGVLLHPTSLPGPNGSGDFGPAAYHFIDWLAGAGQSLWQILPLGGIGPGNSPYMSSSAFAGNLLLIDLAELQAQGWLKDKDTMPVDSFSEKSIDFAKVVPWRMQRLRTAATHFETSGSTEQHANFSEFTHAQAGWLNDYASFMTLADVYCQKDWSDWPAPIAQRKPEAMAEVQTQYATQIFFWKFTQWCFFRQWQKLREYAHSRAIKIIGDAPIFIAYQSAEVWARPELFELNAAGKPEVIAGVPPDFFSASGQRWGNPLYRWNAHKAEHYTWWIERIRHTFSLVDIVRIDHFRGFADYWEIPAHEPTAVNGRWVKGPGAELFHAIEKALGDLPIIAEDLGIITEEVDALRRQFQLPGMRILHFAFGGDADNAYLPHNYESNTVVYTGTHDNDTTHGWWRQASQSEREHATRYLNIADEQEIHWELIRAAAASVADTAIHPMQDILGLGGECRMNLPGVGEGYWAWRFSWDQVTSEHAQRLKDVSETYRRAR
jgi:4-alpha-glucanotransferase